LQQRIRLLPTILSDDRMLNLVKRVDVVLDSFPYGGSLYHHAPALSVGTPVVTLATGTLMKTPKEELKEIRARVHQRGVGVLSQGGSRPSNRSRTLAFLQNVIHDDITWIPSMSPLTAYYRRIGIDNLLVASNITEFAKFAADICTEQELAYDVRVRLLDSMDTSTSEKYDDISGIKRRNKDDNVIKNDLHDKKAFDEDMKDLEVMFDSVGKTWRDIRLIWGKNMPQSQTETQTPSSSQIKSNKRGESSSKTDSKEHNMRQESSSLFTSAGSITPEDSEEVHRRSITTW